MGEGELSRAVPTFLPSHPRGVGRGMLQFLVYSGCSFKIMLI